MSQCAPDKNRAQKKKSDDEMVPESEIVCRCCDSYLRKKLLAAAAEKEMNYKENKNIKKRYIKVVRVSESVSSLYRQCVVRKSEKKRSVEPFLRIAK